MTDYAHIDTAAHEGAHGHNDLSTPTPGQHEAGNYKKGRVAVQGIPCVIENPRGTLREWRAADGTSGANLMKLHYGYIAGTLGNDGDEVDCYIGPWPEADAVYVVNQNVRGKFDEHKCMIGFPDERTARAGYLSNFNSGWPGLHSITACSMAQFKWWLAHGNKARPLTPDQLPHEGKPMDKVIWDSANSPVGKTLDQVLYGLRANDGSDGLIFDPVCMADILADSDGVQVMDAMIVPFARLQSRMELLVKILNRASTGPDIVAMQVSDPFTQKGTTNVAVVFELSDGQTISVFFHNPDTTPKKIAPTDDVISWKWLLNKKDVTVAVAPERGRDLDVRTVAARLMKLADKNSPRFIKANVKRAERMSTIESLKQEVASKEAELNDLQQQIAAFGDVSDESSIEPNPNPEPTPNPDPQPEPQPEPEPQPQPEPQPDPEAERKAAEEAAAAKAAEEAAAAEAARIAAEKEAAEKAAAEQAAAEEAARAAAEKAAAEQAAAEAAAKAAAEQAAAEQAAAEAEAARKAAEAQESADGDFLASVIDGNEDFYDKSVTDRLAELAKKYTGPDSAYADMIAQAKTVAKNFFIAEFKKKVA
jgi:outer membrane biosynthesis protein TonB